MRAGAPGVSPLQVQPITVADAVTAELRRRLLLGLYAEGTQLRDTELAAEFGVARPTIRAAVATLVADGLLARGRGRSAEVRSFTARDAVDLYRLRRAIEGAAIADVIARRADLSGVRASAEAFSALTEATGWDVVADHDVAFHRAVMAASGSARLLRAFDMASAEHRLLIAILRPAYASVRELATEHQALFLALANGDPQVAAEAWSAHFDESERFLTTLITERAQ